VIEEAGARLEIMAQNKTLLSTARLLPSVCSLQILLMETGERESSLGKPIGRRDFKAPASVEPPKLAAKSKVA